MGEGEARAADAASLRPPGKLKHEAGDAAPEASAPSARLANVSRAAVLMLTILWATNFPVIKVIYASGLSPPEYAIIRFSLSAAALLPLARWDDRELLKGSARCGAWVATGYITQAIALTTASANKGAFICSCQVIFVALVNAVRKRQCVPRTWLASLLAVVGVGMLELAGPVQPELADLWCIGMPVCFGMGYVQLEALMELYPKDARTVSALKVTTVGAAVLCWAALRALVMGNGAQMLATLTSAHLPWASLLYTGLVTTAGAILVESYAFKYVPATDAAVILATEPLWATLFAAYFVGEQLTRTDVAGGAFVLAACIVNEVQGVCAPSGRDSCHGQAHEKVPLLPPPGGPADVEVASSSSSGVEGSYHSRRSSGESLRGRPLGSSGAGRCAGISESQD